MLEELKTFITVIELESFTRAGERLNVSQPTVSLHIKRLEEYFSESLIIRSRKQKRPVITAAGKRLYQQAKKLLSLWEFTFSYVRDEFACGSGSITVGATFTIGEYFLPEFLGIFKRKYPDIKVEVEIGNTKRISELLRGYKIDAAIVEGNIIDERFIKRHLYEDRLVIIMHQDHAEQALSDEQWIIREKGSGTRSQWEYLLGGRINELKFKPLIMNSNFAVKEAVRNGLGIALISEYIAVKAEKSREVIIGQKEVQGARFFDLLLHKESMDNKIVDIFCANIREFFEEKQKNSL